MLKILDIDTWSEVFETLKKNKKRTLTTAAGVFWGIFLLTLLLASGQGLINGQKRTYEALGGSGQIVIITPSKTALPYHGYAKNRFIYLRDNDCQILKKKYPAISAIETVVTDWNWGGTMKCKGKQTNYSLILGCSPHYFDIMQVVLLEGRLLTTKDNLQEAHNCIIGEELAKRLFPQGSAIGEIVQFQNSSFKVVGVVRPMTDNMTIYAPIESSVVIPQKLMTSLFVPGIHYSGLIISLDANKLSKEKSSIGEQILKDLKERHNIAPEDKTAIDFFDVSQMVALSKGLILGISILVWIVGIGTLLAGIIGITNILLVSISERTKEIGVRKALGARNRDIRFQILLESFTITFVAGVLGMTLGTALMLIVDIFLGTNNNIFFHPLPPSYITILILAIVALAGMLASVLPIAKALKIDPIKALQNE